MRSIAAWVTAREMHCASFGKNLKRQHVEVLENPRVRLPS